MTLIAYIDKQLSAPKLEVVEQANAIIEDYRVQGFDLTLRQLYYQFVARGLIPNRQQEYKRLGDTIAEARMVGLVSWDAIVDRTRYLRTLPSWRSPKEVLAAVADQFRTDKWAKQPFRPEVWIEKDALIGVIEPVCNELQVPYFSCRGYTSLSEMWSAAQRLLRWAKRGQKPYIIHLGDHDPSGIDMTRDIVDRLETFFDGHGRSGGLQMIRVALNMDQVQQYNPPPNPAKLTDSRCAGYIRRFGDDSWELDALEPAVIADRIREEVYGIRDASRWTLALEAEDEQRELLTATHKRWREVTDFLEGEDQ